QNQQFPDDLTRQLRLKPGMIHDPRVLIEDEVTIGDYYERLGYRKAQIESSIEKKGDGLIVHYDLKKGEIATIDSVEIAGAKFTKESLIRKRIGLKEGEILNQDKIANAQKNLTDLRIFHQVTVRAVPTPEDPNRYAVVADLIERNHYELIYGIRYDTETDIGGEIQLTDLNLLGTGQTVSLYTRIHQQDQLYRILYHSPTLSGLRWKTLISASYERGNLLLLENDKFDGERFDVTIQRQINLGNDFLLIPGYQFEILTLIPLETPNINPVDGLKVSRFIGTLFRDSRDDPFNTKRGTFFSTDLQVATGWLGDVSYLKNYNQYIKILPYRKFTWASAVRVGLATDLPERVVTERFFAGGSFSIRGFKKDQV
ncbi:MAG: POTRA domain-containing protein, partial [Acidobacteriota bacterium]